MRVELLAMFEDGNFEVLPIVKVEIDSGNLVRVYVMPGVCRNPQYEATVVLKEGTKQLGEA